MVAYGYTEEGIYSGVVPMQANPKEKGAWLLPANATTIAPPDQSTYTADYTPVFNEDLEVWELVKSNAKITEELALLNTANEYGIGLYERDIEGNVVLRAEAEVLAETDIVQKNTSLEDAHSLMESNIISKAKIISGGGSSESAQAFFSAYHVRANNPSQYVTENLVAHYATGSYVLGDALDTEIKITDYYTALIIEMDKFRTAEINTYLATKASLGF